MAAAWSILDTHAGEPPNAGQVCSPLSCRARRGGSLAGRGRGNIDTRAILQRLKREDEEEVEEEGNSDSDFSVSSDLGPILNVIL